MSGFQVKLRSFQRDWIGEAPGDRIWRIGFAFNADGTPREPNGDGLRLTGLTGRALSRSLRAVSALA